MANQEAPAEDVKVEDTKVEETKAPTTAKKRSTSTKAVETPAPAETPAADVETEDKPVEQAPAVETPAANVETEDKPVEQAPAVEHPREAFMRSNFLNRPAMEVTLEVTNNGPRSFEVFTKADLPAGKTVKIVCRNRGQANAVISKLKQLNALAKKQRYEVKEV